MRRDSKVSRTKLVKNELQHCPKRYNFVLINGLYRERLLLLGQEVDSKISNQLVGLMIYLSIEDDTRDLYLFIIEGLIFYLQKRQALPLEQ